MWAGLFNIFSAVQSVVEMASPKLWGLTIFVKRFVLMSDRLVIIGDRRGASANPLFIEWFLCVNGFELAGHILDKEKLQCQCPKPNV